MNGAAPVTLGDLRERFPEWEFSAHWTSAGSGPDRKNIVAHRGNVTLSAWTAEGIARAIGDYESGQR